MTSYEVECYNFSSRESFQTFLQENRKPLVIRNADIGRCKEKWTVDYLSQVIGDTDVKVHVSPVGRMSFLDKNFSYKTLKFSNFIARASSNKQSEWFYSDKEHYYLRSIGFDKRGRDISDIRKHFPSISRDINFPDLFEEKDLFSSVFRISSAGIQIWTHYDIVDNMLIQVVGEKKVVLFPPIHARYLYLKEDKSQVLDIDNPDPVLYPDFYKANRYECILKPGDVLFIPALWFHNTLAISFGISVNVFWRNLPHEFYDKTDVYGNKDLVPAAKALSLMNKGLELLRTLPDDYKSFYIEKAMMNLKKETSDLQIKDYM